MVHMCTSNLNPKHVPRGGLRLSIQRSTSLLQLCLPFALVQWQVQSQLCFRLWQDMTISFSSLIGAANMNNTFCLGIFLALIFFKKLVWEFTAETIAIIVAELIMFVFSQRSVHRLMDAGLVFAIYPLTLGIVAGLEAAGLN